MFIEEIEKELFVSQDEEYRKFQKKLMPTVDIENIIGVRTPTVRSLAKKYFKDERVGEFLDELPHKYYDEYNLHGFIITEIKDYSEAIKRVDEFLPYVDNWATCDLLSPKAFKKNREKLIFDIERWISSDKPFTIRFGIEMAMSHFLDEDFSLSLMNKISKVKSEEYYVKMMVAWYFATALAKQWDSSLPYIADKKLGVWEHNKTIQKAVESYRITDEQKEYLKSLKIKGE